MKQSRIEEQIALTDRLERQRRKGRKQIPEPQLPGLEPESSSIRFQVFFLSVYSSSPLMKEVLLTRYANEDDLQLCDFDINIGF